MTNRETARQGHHQHHGVEHPEGTHPLHDKAHQEHHEVCEHHEHEKGHVHGHEAKLPKQ